MKGKKATEDAMIVLEQLATRYASITDPLKNLEMQRRTIRRAWIILGDKIDALRGSQNGGGEHE